MSKLGDVMHELEDVVSQMVEDHDLQKGEILALVQEYIDVHHPGAIEEYQDGTSPIYCYGSLELFAKLYKKQLKELLNV